MKRTKFLLTFICLLGVASTFAQKVNGIALKDLDAEYIEVNDEMLFGMKIIQITIDYGQKKNAWDNKAELLVDENNKPCTFNSMMGVINFLNKYGYELVSTYPVQKIEKPVIRHYILKKRKSDTK